jgi:hypothetical protein
MPKSKSPESKRKTYRGADALEAAQAKGAGVDFQWHFGRITRIGHYEAGGLKEVTIVWEEGGVTSHHDVSDEQWEIFKLAFLGTGRLAILSDETGESWMYDHRFLEAVR